MQPTSTIETAWESNLGFLNRMRYLTFIGQEKRRISVISGLN